MSAQKIKKALGYVISTLLGLATDVVAEIARGGNGIEAIQEAVKKFKESSNVNTYVF